VRAVDRYDAFFIDLDGVLYRGAEPIPGAPETVEAIRASGKRVVFVTNNSWRTPEQVAARLERMGMRAGADDVVTSAQATAALLAGEQDGATAFVLGGEGVRTALAEAGIEPLSGEPDRATYVVVGWDADLTYDRLRTATILVGRGARLVATNADASYPAPGGEAWPGAGALVAAVETGSGRRARVVGKPHRPLFDMAVERVGTRAALVVGDRIETDIVGAKAAELDSALVLTGASVPADLLAAEALPTAVLDDIGGLLEERPWEDPRPARPVDLGPVWSLIERPSTTEPWGPDGVWVIEGDSGVLATATIETRAGDAYIRGVATREDLRKRHLATQVVAAAVREARGEGAARAWLLTETAEGFFTRLGFSRRERSGLPSWILEGPATECPEAAVPMGRDLGQ
jgi:glycerol-1-phosphatase